MGRGLERFKSAAEKFFSPGLGEEVLNSQNQTMPTIANFEPQIQNQIVPFPPMVTPQFQSEGNLAIDVYHTPDALILTAPVAGVRPEDLEVAVTDEVLTIRGKRKREDEIANDSLLLAECFWGDFSRSYPLPFQVVPDSAQAQIKDGILRIIIPKLDAVNKKVIKVKSI